MYHCSPPPLSWAGYARVPLLCQEGRSQATRWLTKTGSLTCSFLVSFTQYRLHRSNTASDAWGSIATWTVPYGSLRNMKCNLQRAFPFLLITGVFSLPSNRSYRNGDGLQQAAFHAQGLSEEPLLEWELPPNPNSTHHLIFNSVSGFLQRWPNTLRRNGALDRSLQNSGNVR